MCRRRVYSSAIVHAPSDLPVSHVEQARRSGPRPHELGEGDRTAAREAGCRRDELEGVQQRALLLGLAWSQQSKAKGVKVRDKAVRWGGARDRCPRQAGFVTSFMGRAFFFVCLFLRYDRRTDVRFTRMARMS